MCSILQLISNIFNRSNSHNSGNTVQRCHCICIFRLWAVGGYTETKTKIQISHFQSKADNPPPPWRKHTCYLLLALPLRSGKVAQCNNKTNTRLLILSICPSWFIIAQHIRPKSNKYNKYFGKDDISAIQCNTMCWQCQPTWTHRVLSVCRDADAPPMPCRIWRSEHVLAATRALILPPVFDACITEK